MSPLRPVAPEPSGAAGAAPLPARLTDPDPGVRRRAAIEAGPDRCWLPMLLTRLGAEPDPGVREALCTQLSRHDLPEVVDGLLPHLASPDAGLRAAVVGVLAATTTATVGRLEALTGDPDSDIRIIGVMVLSRLQHPAAAAALLDLVRTDPHPNVVAAAVSELAPRLDADGRAEVRVALARFAGDPFLQFVAADVLAGPDPHGQDPT